MDLEFRIIVTFCILMVISIHSFLLFSLISALKMFYCFVFFVILLFILPSCLVGSAADGREPPDRMNDSYNQNEASLENPQSKFLIFFLVLRLIAI